MKSELKARLLGFPGFEALCRLMTRRHVRSLMYHRFSAAFVPDSRFVDPIALDAQMRYIRDHHTVIEPDGHLRALEGRGPGPCPVAVTVDDGYADFHDVAYPVFARHRIPAMLFVATGFVSGTTWFWWDKLAFIIAKAEPRIFQFDEDAMTGTLDLTSDEARKKTWHKTADKCRFLADADKEDFLAQLARLLDIELPSRPPSQFSPVSWDQIRDMEKGGIRFGAHTVNHPILSRVPPETARDEIYQSKEQLEGEITQPVRWFAYPQGGPADYNPEIKAMLREHFDASYIAYQDMDARAEPYEIPRYCMTDDMVDFRWTLCGAEFLVLKVRKILGLQTGATESYWAGSKSEGATNE